MKYQVISTPQRGRVWTAAVCTLLLGVQLAALGCAGVAVDIVFPNEHTDAGIRKVRRDKASSGHLLRDTGPASHPSGAQRCQHNGKEGKRPTRTHRAKG